MPNTNWHYFQLTAEDPASLCKSLTRHHQNTTWGNKSLPSNVKLHFDHCSCQDVIIRWKTWQPAAHRQAAGQGNSLAGQRQPGYLQTHKAGITFRITFAISFLSDAAVMRPQRWPWVWVPLWHQCHSQHKQEPNSLLWGRCQSSSSLTGHRLTSHLPTSGMVLTLMLFSPKILLHPLCKAQAFSSQGSVWGQGAWIPSSQRQKLQV